MGKVPFKDNDFLVSFHLSSSIQFFEPPMKPKIAHNFETSRMDLYSSLAARLIFSMRVSRERLF